MQKILFFHGGPGLNSNPEKQLLTQPLKNAGFEFLAWNEPSRLRPDNYPFNPENAVQNYFQSAEEFFLSQYNGEPLIIAGHSFGANAITHLHNEYPDKIKMMVYIAPVHLMSHLDKNVFRFILADYQLYNDTKTAEMQHVFDKLTHHYNNNTEKGWRLVFENPRLLEYYWVDKSIMHNYLQYFAPPQFQIDTEGFFSLRLLWKGILLKESNKPAIVVLGGRDVTSSNNSELLVLNKLSNLESHIFSFSAHYPHIEETEKLINVLQAAIK